MQHHVRNSNDSRCPRARTSTTQGAYVHDQGEISAELVLAESSMGTRTQIVIQPQTIEDFHVDTTEAKE